jgi:cytochrome P450
MEYNPLLPEVKDNPYPYYAYLRQHAPAYQIESLGFWALSRYDDVDFVLKNPKLFSSATLTRTLIEDLEPVPEVPSMVSSDPPEHTRLRKLVNKAFTPRIIRSLGPRIREIAQDLLNRVAGHKAFDLVRDLSIPLPVIVIAEMLGVEPDQRETFKHWSDDIVMATNRTYTAEDERRIRQSIAEFRAYFQETIAARRKEPREDLTTALVQAEEERQVLTASEVLSLLTLLLLAGNETTTNLIGNMMLALCEHPDQLAKVRADRSLITNAVEETLRYDGPVQGLPRQATEDVEIAETTIPAGALVFPLFASANRDEHKFPEPDRFDITRNTDGHLAFGFGIHYCLGAQLARLEATIAFEELFVRFPSLSRQDETVTRVDSFFLRGLKTFPLVANGA